MTDARLVEDARRRVSEVFPTQIDLLVSQLQHLAGNMQSCDVTFRDRAPILDVKLNREFARTFITALRHWKPANFAKLLQRIHFSDGTITPIDSIWIVVPLPRGGISINMMQCADLALAETVAGNGGESIREMIKAAYMCATEAELDWHIRRWIAS